MPYHKKVLTPIVLYLRHTNIGAQEARTCSSEELPKKRRRTEFSVSSNWQPWCPSAGTVSNIDVGSYRGPHPNWYTVRQWPERLGHWAYQSLDRRGTQRAGIRPRQQC